MTQEFFSNQTINLITKNLMEINSIQKERLVVEKERLAVEKEILQDISRYRK